MERSGTPILWVKSSGHSVQRPLSVSGTFHSFEASHNRLYQRSRCFPGHDGRFRLDPDLSNQFRLLPSARTTNTWLIWERWFDTACGFVIQQVIVNVPILNAPYSGVVIREF